jgi:branched-chain amino acid transport system permease protein
MEWLNILVQGTLLGGFYALFAIGLSMSFGIMRLVNIAHGDLIVLSAYVGLVIIAATGLDPLVGVFLVVPVMFALGYVLQRGILNFTLSGGLLPPLLVTFGISIIIQNGLLQGFGTSDHRLQTGVIQTASMKLAGGLTVGVFPVVVLTVAVLAIASLQLMFYRTRLGRAFRAVSDDADTAELMGIDNRKLYAVAFGIAMAYTAIAGVLFGVAQDIGAALDPTWQILAGHLAFLAILIVRPSGLFPRTRD